MAQDIEHIDRKKVQDCIEKAGLRQKIESLSEAYDTLLDRNVYTEATELSGGELQRLMIARLLYKDCPIVVLDEPTAALDPIAESDIYEKYHELTSGKLQYLSRTDWLPPVSVTGFCSSRTGQSQRRGPMRSCF